MAYPLEEKRQLISLFCFHGPSHVFQFSYFNVKGDGPARRRLIWKKKKENKKVTNKKVMASAGEYAIKKQANNLWKSIPLIKPRAVPIKICNHYWLETNTLIFSHTHANVNKPLSLKMLLLLETSIAFLKTNYSSAPNAFISFYRY